MVSFHKVANSGNLLDPMVSTLYLKVANLPATVCWQEITRVCIGGNEGQNKRNHLFFGVLTLFFKSSRQAKGREGEKKSICVYCVVICDKYWIKF